VADTMPTGEVPAVGAQQAFPGQEAMSVPPATTGEVPAVSVPPATTGEVPAVSGQQPAAGQEAVGSPAATVPDGAPVTVIGLAGDRIDLLAPEARQALGEAQVVVGGRRQLWLWQSWEGRPTVGSGGRPPETIEVQGDVDELAQIVRQRATEASQRVAVLASGDPGFFGILRGLVRTVDRRSIRVLPAASSVSLAFARLGLPWDDATVMAVHGRPLADVAGALRTAPKAAVLTSPDAPAEAVGQALMDAGAAMDLVAVCSRLGAADEQVVECTLPELAAGRWDPRSVVVLVGPGNLPLVGWAPGLSREDEVSNQVLAWGLPDSAFARRSGMITRAEVRSVVLGKLALPAAGVLWDVGAGSGSVAVECSMLRPGLTVLAVEETPEDAARASANALALGAGVHVVTGHAPATLRGLPLPDRAFVGGGGLDVLDAVLGYLRPGGRVVATFTAMDRAAAAAERLGNLVQVGVGRGVRLPDGGWRLDARNPVFVAWGPGHSSPDDPDADAEADLESAR
jgi:precorrin-6B C5,15-methyltransferase / cobalt-precorrin-6B C5,C15-methyltransferase